MDRLNLAWRAWEAWKAQLDDAVIAGTISPQDALVAYDRARAAREFRRNMLRAEAMLRAAGHGEVFDDSWRQKFGRDSLAPERRAA